MSISDDDLKQWMHNYFTEQAEDRLDELIGHSQIIACPACHAPAGHGCNGSRGSHSARIERYLAQEFTTLFAACEGIEE